MARTRSTYYLPEDMVFQILSWLPVISLLRSRAVCKLWRSIISNPQFVETHLANSQKKQAHVLRFNRIVRNVEDFVDDFEDIAFIDTRDASFRLDLPPQFVGMYHHIRSCNGLVCLSNTHGDVINLWNPSTKLFKKLPTPKIQACCFDFDLGFCFDSVSKDYKLLRIVLSNISNDRIVTPVLKAELYSANADSWKEIHFPKTVTHFYPYPYSKCVHAKTGVLYMEGLFELLSFDLRNEAIEVYPFNTPLKDRMSNVLDFEGYVGIIPESDTDASLLSIWTLDDVSGKMVWTKKFNLESDLKLDYINLYLGVGEFVAKNEDVGYMFYDSRKKTTKKFPDPSDISDVRSVVKYTESLVSLNGFKQLE